MKKLPLLLVFRTVSGAALAIAPRPRGLCRAFVPKRVGVGLYADGTDTWSLKAAPRSSTGFWKRNISTDSLSLHATVNRRQSTQDVNHPQDSTTARMFWRSMVLQYGM